MALLLEILLHYLLFLGASKKRSTRIYSLLKALPSSFTLAFEIESTGEILLMLQRRGDLWSVLRNRDLFPEGVTWSIRFRSSAVLRQILFLKLSLQQAFVERKMSLRGSIADTIRILKLFESLIVTALPWEAWVRGLSREMISTSKTRALILSLCFVFQLPFQILRKETRIL
jgi:hypothetical protein